MKKSNYSGVAFLSPSLPRQCGIATFTNDLFNSVKKHSHKNKYSKQNNTQHQIIAVENKTTPRDYEDEVTTIIKDDRLEDYRVAANKVNHSSVSTISLQHEYNLYGGEEGDYILEFLEKTKKPVVTTMHTVHQDPSPYRKKVTKEICNYSARVIVMAEKAAGFLQSVYGVEQTKIDVVPHGIHPVGFTSPESYKHLIGREGRKVILTFGLLDRLKGVEHVIDAMKKVTEENPDALFIVLGATHPIIKEKEGEDYRNALIRRVQENNLNDHVKFHNEFVSLEKLIEYLMATDIFITPYLNKERITSGALAYAVACGKAVVSTPYYYAEELLREDCGRLVPFRDSAAIARELNSLFADSKKFNRLRKNAYRLGMKMRWGKVAEEYNKVFNEVSEKKTMGYRHRSGKSAVAAFSR